MASVVPTVIGQLGVEAAWTDLEHGGDLYSLDFSSDGKSLATAAGSVRIWNLADGTYKELNNVRNPVQFLTDGQTLVTGANDATAWTTTNWQSTAVCKGTLVAVSPSGVVVVRRG